jgi:molybdopterin/thiamine biosynthesis adenylyltransferase
MRQLESTKRFSGALWAGNKLEINIIGCGGIGAILALYLARQGHKLNLFDFDTFELTNLAGQFATNSNVGLNKAVATKKLVEEFVMKPEIKVFDKAWNPEMFDKIRGINRNIVINCADSMTVRNDLLKYWLQFQLDKTKRPPNEVNIFLDGRMSLTSLEVFAINNTKNAKTYLIDYIFDESTIQELPCNMKATTHCGAIAAGLITSLLNNHTANKLEGVPIYDVPFYTRVDLDTFEFNSIK